MSLNKHLRMKGILALAAAAVGGTALAATFVFSYVGSYGANGLSQPFAATTTTGQSYARALDISHSDTSQKVYSLVQANSNSSSASYYGPYYIVRRLSNGNIDTGFGANGYITSFPLSGSTGSQLHDLCVDPGTGNMVVVANNNNSGTNGITVERLLPPAAGSGSATLDTSFNGSGTLTVATPAGNSNPTPQRCAVSNQGTGNNG